MRKKNYPPQNATHSSAQRRALRTLARMRRNGETLSQAARAEEVDPRTVRKYLGGELRQMASGRTQPTSTDKRQREMLILTSSGPAPTTIRGSQQASQLGRYLAAVGKFLRTGEVDALDEFEGKKIAGHVLITDPETLMSLAQAGALQLDEIYSVPESSS